MTHPESAEQPRASDLAPYAAASIEGASKSGRFVWHDLMTTDPSAAHAFYTALFGWKTRDVDMGPAGMYTMWNAAGKDIGGMMRPDQAQGAPPHWMSYATVANVDAAVRRALDLGGTAPLPGTDIPSVGRFAVLADPAGASISPFTPLEGQVPPEESGPFAPGTFAWDELLTTDPEGATAFYTEVFGWSVEPMDMGPMGTYYLFKRGQINAAGMMKMPDDATAPPNWLPYVAVTDADASAEQITELGGKIFVPPTSIPNVGRFAVAADPTGAAFAILQASEG